MIVNTRRSIRDPLQDKIMYFFINTVLVIFAIIIMYPCVYVVSASFSDSLAVITGRVILFPVDFSLEGYKMIFTHKLIMSSYRNTIFYAVAGTAINLVMTVLAAYPMSRRELPFRNILMFLFVFTMYFTGGIVPTYILMSNLRLINKFWIMILPTLSIYNMILMRTNFMSLPEEMHEAAKIDGCSYIQYMLRILLPLSKPVLAVIILFYAVGHWNSYFSALIYLSNRDLFPLQLVLREILLAAQIKLSDIGIEAEELANKQGMADLIKYAGIVAASAPVIAMYPFVQKYFVKGIMIGSLKG